MTTALEMAFRQRLKYHAIGLFTLCVFVLMISRSLFAGQEGTLVRSVLNAYATGCTLLAIVVVWSVLGETVLREAWRSIKESLKLVSKKAHQERFLLIWFIMCMVGGSWFAAAHNPGAADIGVSAAMTAVAIPEILYLIHLKPAE
jgi:hypothetical protein